MIKKKVTIEIEATFGSHYQEEVALSALSAMLKAWKSHYTWSHQKNKIKINVKIE